MDDARGFWIGKGGRQRLIWRIDGEMISDTGLSRWVRENMPYYEHAHDGVIRNRHTVAFASRNTSKETE